MFETTIDKPAWCILGVTGRLCAPCRSEDTFEEPRHVRMPARDSPAPRSGAAPAPTARDASWRTPDVALQGLEQEYAPAHQRRCAAPQRLEPIKPQLEGNSDGRGRSAFAWRTADAEGEMLMPMTEAEADAYDRSEATAGNTLTYLTACGLSVAGSAQSALTFAGSGDMGTHSTPGSGKILRLGSDGPAGERDALWPTNAKRRAEVKLEAGACPGLPGAGAFRQEAAPECAGVQGPVGAQDSAACGDRGHMRFGAPWVPALPAGAPAHMGASEAATGLCMGTPADEALLAGLVGDPGGYGAGCAAAQAQPLAAPARSAPGGFARALLACGGPVNPIYDPNPLGPAGACAPLELARGMPGSLPALGAYGPWFGLGLGPESGQGSGYPAGIRGGLPQGYAGAEAPEDAGVYLGGAPLGPGRPASSPGPSGPALATPELRQSELQLSLGMGLGLQLDLGAWQYGPGEGTGPCGAPLQAPPGGAFGRGCPPAAGLWGAMLEGAGPAGSGAFGGSPHGFADSLPKREQSHAGGQVRCPLKAARL